MAISTEKLGPGEAKLRLSRHFARIAKKPLVKQNTSDAWNERQRRLTAARDSAQLLIKGTIEKNQAKRVAKAKKKSAAKKKK